jgi:hypothetical protein
MTRHPIRQRPAESVVFWEVFGSIPTTVPTTNVRLAMDKCGSTGQGDVGADDPVDFELKP